MQGMHSFPEHHGKWFVRSKSRQGKRFPFFGLDSEADARIIRPVFQELGFCVRVVMECCD